jgi:hypothetical protein
VTQPTPNPQKVARDQAIRLLHLRKDSPEVAAIMVLLQTLSREARDDLTKIVDMPSIYRVQGSANTVDQLIRWITIPPIAIPQPQPQQE